MTCALTSIETGASLEASPDRPDDTGGGTNCAFAIPETAAAERPAVSCRKARREAPKPCSGFPRGITPAQSGVQPASRSRCSRRGPLRLAEQFSQFLGDGATKLFGVHESDGAAVLPCDVVTDADCDQFDGRARLDFLDDVAQVPLRGGAGGGRRGG